MKRLAVVVVLVVLVGCSSLPKPYIGETIGYDHPLVTKIDKIPACGEVQVKVFKIIFNLYKLKGKSNTYRIKGEIFYSAPDLFAKYNGGIFALMLIKDGVVVDSISFLPKGDRIEKGLYYERVFYTSYDFDAIGFGWGVRIRS
jgi:hypothetical protein